MNQDMRSSEGSGADFGSYTKALINASITFKHHVEAILSEGPRLNRRTALEELNESICKLINKLSAFLARWDFWYSDTVTDWAGVDELITYKDRVEKLDSRAMSAAKRSDCVVQLERIKTSVDQLWPEFAKLRQDMVVRNIARAGQRGEDKGREDQQRGDKLREAKQAPEPIPPEPELTTEDKKATQYSGLPLHRYFSVIVGTFILGSPLIDLIPRFILFAIALHTFPAIWWVLERWSRSKSTEPPAKETWKDMATPCPVYKHIEKKGYESRGNSTTGTPVPRTAEATKDNVPGAAA